ncbi:heme lyase CcmF/NrfE family subunit [Woodsholea maritima]|uniref:heme lyase CcmF/NrfE family subunit n=1 Tax=Woodsholea maritima TaxID=240237 RepID=UPI00036DD978|nr:heme lyase CcmF/NrfE family subunit [Woodsholea maritima]
MIAELGRYLIAMALLASLVQMVFAWLGANRGGEGPLSHVAKASNEVATVSAFVAFLLLIYSFVRSDFSIAYVAAKSHVDKPMLYKVAAAWGGHEGSMLLWCLILCLFALAMVHFGPKLARMRLRALSFQGGLQGLFFAFLALASNPFDRVDPAPLAGADLNPILQDPALAFHPPMLYIGYVGLSAAFAIAAGGLWEKVAAKDLARAIRPWALFAWSGLTAGIALGAYWAYYELGWGGWWFWDPVENASFMPWLVGAALIHSAIATEKRGAFPGWTAFLALLAFILSILGAFLVRSGVLTSVHAFALDPERGMWILAMLAFAALVGMGVFALRVTHLKEGEGFAPTSREALIGANNLLLAASAGVVLVGTLYPLLAEVLGARVSVGAPYFNATTVPIFFIMLVLLPFAAFLPWAKGGMKRALAMGKVVLWCIPMVIVGAIFAVMGAPFMAIVAAMIGAWVLAGVSMDLWAHRQLEGSRLALWARGLAHAGVALIALGAAADAARPADKNPLMAPGESVTIAERTLRFEALSRADGPNYLADRARFTTDSGAVMAPERRFYPVANQNTREVAIRSSLMGDLYMAIGEPRMREDGQLAYEVRAAFHPLIWALGLGALMIMLGGMLAFIAHTHSRQSVSEDSLA